MSVSITNTHLLQTIIATRSPITVDGIFGPKSRAAYESLPERFKRTVKHVSVMLGHDIDNLSSAGTTVSLADTTTAVEETSFLTGVPESYLFMTIRLENIANRKLGGFVLDLTGKHRGLGQFDKDTWDAVMHPTSFDDVGSTSLSILAIARLYKRNLASFINHGYREESFTDELAYLYHNQGAHSASVYLSTGVLNYPDQSLDALRLFKKARSNYGTRLS